MKGSRTDIPVCPFFWDFKEGRTSKNACPTRKMYMGTNWTIDGVKEALAAKKISARELAADFYKRI